MKRTWPTSIACCTVPAWALAPSPATRSLSSSGWREENSTSWPSFAHSPPIVPPIWPEPITPMRDLPPLACAIARRGTSAALSNNAPPAPSSARRSRLTGSCPGIETSSLWNIAHSFLTAIMYVLVGQCDRVTALGFAVAESSKICERTCHGNVRRRLEPRCAGEPLRRGAPFHRQLGVEAGDVAEDRGDREHAAVASIADEAILRFDTAVDRDLVPPLGVADIVDRHVIVLAPEERHGVETLIEPEHVGRRGLALTFGDDPMLDAHGLAGMRVGPAGDVAGGIDAGRARLQKGIDDHAAVDLEARLLGQRQARPHADADNDEIGVESGAALETRAGALDRGDRFAEVEDDAVLLVQLADEVAELRAEHTFHRPHLRRRHVDLDIARAQGSRSLEPNEAGTDDQRPPRAFGAFDDCPAIGERAQRMDVRQIGAGDRKPHRLGAGRQQQTVVSKTRATGETDLALFHVDAGNFGAEPQLDVVLRIKRIGAQRQPILRRAAGKIILGQIGPVDRRRAIIAQHHDAAAVVAPPQHLGRGEAGGAAADDDDLSGRIRRRGPAARFCLRALVLDEDAAVPLLDIPAGERAQRGRAHRFPGAQIEAGVMPGTAHALADHDALGERAVIVAAMRGDGEYFGAAAHEQHLLVADMADELAVGEVWERDPLGQVRAARRGLFLRHRRVPLFTQSRREIAGDAADCRGSILAYGW